MVVGVGWAVSEGSVVSLAVGVGVSVAGGVKVPVAAGVGGWTTEVVVVGSTCSGRQDAVRIRTAIINIPS